MVLFRSESFNVNLPENGEWVEVQCTSVPDFNGFRTGLMKALDYVKQHPVNMWLLDFKAIEKLADEEEAWVQVQFFPQLMMLGHENYIAIVVSEGCYRSMLQEVGAFGLKSYNSFIIINTFCHISEAEDWLRTQRLSAAG